MEWQNLRCYSHKRRAPRNLRRASPVPSASSPSALGRRHMLAKVPPLLSKMKQKPTAKKQVEKRKMNVLPKIQENSKVTMMDCLSTEQSVELNYNENRGLDAREHIGETSASPLKASLHLNLACKESLQNSEATSEMTLPSGVSTFLLDCMDMDSTGGPGIKSSDGTEHYSSPEVFRDGSSVEENTVSPEESVRCKNSTLLDTSKAITIEKMPQPFNLSNIFEARLGDQDECIMRPTKRKLSSELTKASTVVAGKQVCKILSATEKTPQQQSSAVLLLPQKQHKQLKDQRSRNMKCRKNVQFSSTVVSYPVALSSTGESALVADHGASSGTLASPLPDADMEFASKATITKKKKTLPPSTSVLQPEDLERLRNPPEICCIITASPDSRPPKVLNRPLNEKILFSLSGVTEDIITSSKNWVYNHDRCINLQNMTEDTCIQNKGRAVSGQI